MANFEIVMPKMGEGIIEAKITKWLKKEGEKVIIDESIVEIATDKVDSEIPAPIEGVLIKKMYNEGEIVAVDKVIAIIEVDGHEEHSSKKDFLPPILINDSTIISDNKNQETNIIKPDENINSEKYISPLVKNMVRIENISSNELNSIIGSGRHGRITKDDLVKHLSELKENKETSELQQFDYSISNSEDTVIEMSRMRSIIAEHMVSSVKISPHVTSIIKVNMSKVVKKRDFEKSIILQQDNEKLTITHYIVEVVAKALKEFPGINASVNGNRIIYKKNINIGIATVLPDGNLIVPVVKNAEQKSLIGIIKNVNDLANRARLSKLNPDEIQGGTFTITNLGSFDTLIGTPIINQPQVAILAIGAIKKEVIVIESEIGDTIGIAPVMYMALTYDHRVVDGSMGGLFLKRLKSLLENFE